MIKEFWTYWHTLEGQGHVMLKSDLERKTNFFLKILTSELPRCIKIKIYFINFSYFGSLLKWVKYFHLSKTIISYCYLIVHYEV